MKTFATVVALLAATSTAAQQFVDIEAIGCTGSTEAGIALVELRARAAVTPLSNEELAKVARNQSKGLPPFEGIERKILPGSLFGFKLVLTEVSLGVLDMTCGDMWTACQTDERTPTLGLASWPEPDVLRLDLLKYRAFDLYEPGPEHRTLTLACDIPEPQREVIEGDPA